jgi:hypothetical protein
MNGSWTSRLPLPARWRFWAWVHLTRNGRALNQEWKRLRRLDATLKSIGLNPHIRNRMQAGR